MSSALVDAKALCNDQILDVLNQPMFTIFQIQHDQIADRVDSDNKLLYHFKQSMSKMSEWNSSVVHDFCTKLMKKFPAIRTCELLSTEMISVICKIMNEAHDSDGRYVPMKFAFHDVLHSFIVECSKVFIEHPEWFSHGVDSTEYQTCLNNARIAMKNRDVVYNATRKYVTLTHMPPPPSSSSSSSSSSPSSPSSSKAFAGAEPTSASGIYLTSGNDTGYTGSGRAEGEDESGNDDEVPDLQITKNINVVTGDVENVAVPVPTFQESIGSHLSNGNIMYPGSMNSSSVYPTLPAKEISLPPSNTFGNLFASIPHKSSGEESGEKNSDMEVGDSEESSDDEDDEDDDEYSNECSGDGDSDEGVTADEFENSEEESEDDESAEDDDESTEDDESAEDEEDDDDGFFDDDAEKQDDKSDGKIEDGDISSENDEEFDTSSDSEDFDTSDFESETSASASESSLEIGSYTESDTESESCSEEETDFETDSLSDESVSTSSGSSEYDSVTDDETESETESEIENDSSEIESISGSSECESEE